MPTRRPLAQAGNNSPAFPPGSVGSVIQGTTGAPPPPSVTNPGQSINAGPNSVGGGLTGTGIGALAIAGLGAIALSNTKAGPVIIAFLLAAVIWNGNALINDVSGKVQA